MSPLAIRLPSKRVFLSLGTPLGTPLAEIRRASTGPSDMRFGESIAMFRGR